MKQAVVTFLFLLITHLVIGQEITDIHINESLEKSNDTILIDPLSVIPLYIETIKKIEGKERVVTSATGFIYKKNGLYYLITNWHVVTGKSPYDLKDIIVNDINISNPEKLRIYIHGINLGTWNSLEIKLHTRKGPQWLEHPNKNKVDVVAIPLKLRVKELLQLKINAINDMPQNEEIIVSPSMNVSIIGFPFGFSSYGKFPIWKTGQVASDLDIDIDQLPLFYIDAATRGGMSGSPVICRANSYSTKKGFTMSSGYSQKFLGIYSGRLPNDSDIGKVWKAKCLDEIIN